MLKKQITIILLLLLMCFSVSVISEAGGSTDSILTAGWYHSLALKQDGTVRAWGYNKYGQLGDSTTSNSKNISVQVNNLTDVITVTGGTNHSLALRSDGTVWAWGYNAHGELGNGTTTDRSTPIQVNNLTDIITVSAGAYHSLGIKSDKTVWAWGYNLYGQLGDGTATNKSTPVQVNNLTDVIAISAGLSHSLALKPDGTVWTWGKNSYGQLGDSTTTSRFIPVQVNNLTDVITVAGGVDHSLALRSDGTVWAWGYNKYGQLGNGTTINISTPVQVSNLTDVIAISGGGQHSLALKPDGTVWTWGQNTYGQLGDGTTTNRSTPVRVNNLTNVIAVSAGLYHSLALKSDGTVWAWGYNAHGELGNNTAGNKYTPVQVSYLQLEPYIHDTIPTIAGGDNYTIVIKDNTLWTFGLNDKGQLGDGTTTYKSIPSQIGISDWKQVSAYYKHTVAIKNDGSLWAWGLNEHGQLGDGTTTDKLTPIQIGTDTDWKRIITGFSHTVALKENGSLWGWGSNTYGQLGDGTTTDKVTPTQIGTDTDWKYITAGSTHTVALKKNGSLWAWGLNKYGQLGDETTTDKSTPIQIGTDTDWIAISAASNHTFALKSDGTLWGSGWNQWGELGDGTTSPKYILTQIGTDTDWKYISAIGDHTAALKEDGSLWTWGQNYYGQLGDGTTNAQYFPIRIGTDNDWVYVSGGTVNTIAAKANGSLWVWGSNQYGQLGDETYQNKNTPKILFAEEITDPSFFEQLPKTTIDFEEFASGTSLTNQLETLEITFSSEAAPDTLQTTDPEDFSGRFSAPFQILTGRSGAGNPTSGTKYACGEIEGGWNDSDLRMDFVTPISAVAMYIIDNDFSDARLTAFDSEGKIIMSIRINEVTEGGKTYAGINANRSIISYIIIDGKDGNRLDSTYIDDITYTSTGVAEEITDPSFFEQLPTATVDFEEFFSGTSLTNQLEMVGITFSSEAAPDILQNTDPEDSLGRFSAPFEVTTTLAGEGAPTSGTKYACGGIIDGLNTSDLRIDFVTPISAFGMYIIDNDFSDARLTAYDSVGNMIRSIIINQVIDGGNTFAGINANNSIISYVIIDGKSGNPLDSTFVDDITFMK